MKITLIANASIQTKVGRREGQMRRSGCTGFLTRQQNNDEKSDSADTDSDDEINNIIAMLNKGRSLSKTQ
jgi:hypothetical protein